METKIISVISGKGGTGKSLFTAVLGNCLAKENCKVLLVDMDIHVRGLTILLSDYIGTEKGMSVTDCLENPNSDKSFITYRFQECEILPAVVDITQPLSKEIQNDAMEIFLKKLSGFVEKKYDVVLLDCRAGLDDTLVKIVKMSNFIISISEDDDVCLQSNLNLVNYLRYKENIINIYTVINKGRRITTKKDIDNKLKKVFDFNCIGVIPFDEIIMEDYGKDRFWLTVYETLYFYAIVKFWNTFRKKASILFPISEDKYDFREISPIHEKTLRGINMSKIFKIYAYIFLCVGLCLSFISNYIYIGGKNVSMLSSFISIIGLLMLAFSSRKFRILLLDQDDEPEKKQ